MKYGNISYDTGIGIFFSFAMALGVLFIALKQDYTFDLSGYLFGNILGVTQTDLLFTSSAVLLFIPTVVIINYLMKSWEGAKKEASSRN